MGEQVSYLGSRAFAACQSLQAIEIPGTISMIVTPFPMTAFFNFLQFKKAPSLISLTESGIVISVNFLLPSKILSKYFYD
mgnify:CR=1 FL=1